MEEDGEAPLRIVGGVEPVGDPAAVVPARFYSGFGDGCVAAVGPCDHKGVGHVSSFSRWVPSGGIHSCNSGGGSALTCFSSNVAISAFDQSTPGGSGRWLWD